MDLSFPRITHTSKHSSLSIPYLFLKNCIPTQKLVRATGDGIGGLLGSALVLGFEFGFEKLEVPLPWFFTEIYSFQSFITRSDARLFRKEALVLLLASFLSLVSLWCAACFAYLVAGGPFVQRQR